ncbi:hypothetical protein [Streptomyces sp. S1D4-20]|uniref:hypothetical protein n=1 Tax=Streptomyces sp. S1D4-20 TaxID=2594462 RepID=UPI0011621DE5|nr:hypothetical protein [Streptomyces sp. S1D4-20]QDN54092.1 hypothetical protein FNV67_00490 [Streptomyces sp. S1D4-20]
MTSVQMLLLTGVLLGLSLVIFAVWGPISAHRWLLAVSAGFTLTGLAGLAFGRNSAPELIGACLWFLIAVASCERPQETPANHRSTQRQGKGNRPT